MDLAGVDSCELVRVPLPFWHKLRKLRIFCFTPSDHSSGHCPPLAAGTSRPTASLSGVDSLKEALTDFGREQVLEDFHVEKPEDVSWGAWQKRQSRQIAKVLAQVAVCRTGDDIVNLAATVLKPPNLEAFLYLFISDRDETAEPLSVPFEQVVSSVHPSSDHRPLPAETDASKANF